MTSFGLRPLTSVDAAAIALWHYPEPYSFYDMAADPEDLAEFLDESNWPDSHFSVVDEGDNLVGFFTLTRIEDRVVIGLGMRPDLTGMGHGLDFLRAGLVFAEERFHPSEFGLSVAAFNARAIKVYERAGFRTVDRYIQQTNGGLFEFIRMTK